ncbi:MAG: PH domain-containing protein [Actinomycetota bacterium]
MQPLPTAVRRLWRFAAIGQAVVIGVVLLGADLVAGRTDLEFDWPPFIGPAIAFTLFLTVGLLMADLRYRSWRFELTEEWIHARWGVVGRRTATVPRNRVQTVTSENGPIDRLLGLTSVTVHTAGVGAPNLSIPHLEDHTVEWLRSELARGAVS